MSAIKKISSILASAGLTALALVAVPSAADAASRNFQIRNESSYALAFRDASRVPCDSTHKYCNKYWGSYDMEFEGRPDDGALLNPGERHDFDLKYCFSLDPAHWGYPNYAADLNYDIHKSRRDAPAYAVRIQTYNTANESDCSKPIWGLMCTADGQVITFRDRPELEAALADKPEGKARDKDKKAGKPKDKPAGR